MIAPVSQIVKPVFGSSMTSEPMISMDHEDKTAGLRTRCSPIWIEICVGLLLEVRITQQFYLIWNLELLKDDGNLL